MLSREAMQEQKAKQALKEAQLLRKQRQDNAQPQDKPQELLNEPMAHDSIGGIPL